MFTVNIAARIIREENFMSMTWKEYEKKHGENAAEPSLEKPEQHYYKGDISKKDFPDCISLPEDAEKAIADWLRKQVTVKTIDLYHNSSPDSIDVGPTDNDIVLGFLKEDNEFYPLPFSAADASLIHIRTEFWQGDEPVLEICYTDKDSFSAVLDNECLQELLEALVKDRSDIETFLHDITHPEELVKKAGESFLAKWEKPANV